MAPIRVLNFLIKMITTNRIFERISSIYNSFLINRHRAIRPLLFGILLLSLVIGASYRVIEIKENLSVNNGFEYYINMASHFWTDPGGYNFEESKKIKENADDYIFTKHPKEPATGGSVHEKGWPLILSLILKEGTKGMDNLALTVARYQLMLDLFVIVLLFFAGRSIAGPLCGILAAILYALFTPSISMMSWISHYYWGLPFSALSLFFWTVVYRPENKIRSLRYTFLLFFFYGGIMGFATMTRLSFQFLPLFMSPLIFLRERAIKRSMVLLFAMIIGQGVFLIPQVLITYKYYDKFTVSTRATYPFAIQGLGAYPNPFGIKDSADLTAVDWAISRGGPDLNKEGWDEYNKFTKKESIQLFKERPDVFLRNFKINFYDGITMTPKSRYLEGPLFVGIMDSDKDAYEANKFAYSLPWLVIFSALILFFFWLKRFGPFIAVVFQGLYILVTLCTFFPPADQHVIGYFPVFVLLLAVSVAILVKGAISIPEGILKCQINNKKVKYWPATINACFREEWDKKHSPEVLEHSKSHDGYPERWQNLPSTIKRIIVSSGIMIFFLSMYIARMEINIKDKKPDDNAIQIINNILTAETIGSFEKWTEGDNSLPDGWGLYNTSKRGVGETRRVTGKDEIWSGTSAAEVRPGSSGSSYLYFHITSDKLYYLLGKTITLAGWVKSDNKINNKAYFEILNGVNMSRFPRAYYKNSGNWERLTLTYKVPDDIQRMSIRLVVDSGANTCAYFDDIELRNN